MRASARLSGLRLRSRLLLAGSGGAAIGLSWQPFGLWPLLLVGIPALTAAVQGVRLRRAFWLGGVSGVVMLGIGLGWIWVLGLPIAVALIVFMSLYLAVMAIGLRLVGALPGWPLWAACCWVLAEFAASRIPFGGFGWARLAYAAVDTPLAGWFPLIGVAGVSFLVALVPHLALYVLLAARLSTRIAAGATAVVVCLAGLGLTGFQVEALDPGRGTVDVGIVQGNVPGRGIDAMGRARSVTNNHLSETINLIVRSRLDGTDLDFVLWPENSTDIDPGADPRTRVTVQTAAELAGVPILVGAVTNGPADDERQTTALWWNPATGVEAIYHKRNLVPFGEWIPFRDQLLPVIPMLALVGRQSVPGTSPGALPVTLGDGRRIVIGDVICFELAYDGTVGDTVRAGAQVLMVQSNNATYGGTGQIEQQFAITRARAMESRREIAVATTSSVSGLIDRSGRVVFRTDEFTAASTSVTMPLRSALTPALTVGPWVDRVLALVGALAMLAGLGVALGRTGREDELSPPVAESALDDEPRVAPVGDTGLRSDVEPAATVATRAVRQGSDP